MGALIADLAFQRRAKYETTVVPRVHKVRDSLKDKPTTTELVAWLQSSTEADRRSIYNSPSKWQVIEDVAKLFAAEGLDTVEEARAAFTKVSDSADRPDRRDDLRSKLIRIRNVGKKTRDYVDILLGSDQARAIDSRIKRSFAAAGVGFRSYDYGVELIDATAKKLDWTPQQVDSALWTAGDKHA
ncbi:hypothetical protein [Galactobacter sp.]|uniref:hypothetical protein n=1 Tax=Galactobacter sp. TaxID=2676125 RepID=UPI0025BBCBE1|nr:hypothetical protein [Galactobacter sp.]